MTRQDKTQDKRRTRNQLRRNAASTVFFFLRLFNKQIKQTQTNTQKKGGLHAASGVCTNALLFDTLVC